MSVVDYLIVVVVKYNLPMQYYIVVDLKRSFDPDLN